MRLNFLVILFLYSLNSFSQIFDTIHFDTRDSIVDIESLPLSALMDEAIKNSSIVKATQYQYKAEEAKLAIEKKRILSGISFVASYNYGNTGVISFQEDNQSAGAYNVQSSTTLSRYLVGGNVKIPLDQVFNRKAQINVVQMNIEMRKELMNKEMEVLRSTVFELYNQLVTQKKLVEIYSGALEANELNMQMAQKQFMKGELEIADISRVTEGYTKASVQYEKTKRDYRSFYSQLELLIGLEIKEIL